MKFLYKGHQLFKYYRKSTADFKAMYWSVIIRNWGTLL